MKINKQNIEVSFTFTPRDYFLVYSDDDRVPKCPDKDCQTPQDHKIWTLNYRIDMSEKGKSDQVGMPRIYLEDKEAEELKTNGFSYVEL